MKLTEFKNTQNKDYPAVDLARKNPELAALISKTVAGARASQKDEQGNRTLTTQVGAATLMPSLQKRAKRNSDAASILKLLPDIELSAQILVSSILSPKDMTTLELIYMGPKNLVSNELSASMLNRIKTYFEETYKIRPLLTEIIRETLFEKGSYPIAVLPENAIDDFINGGRSASLEAFVDPDGIAKPIGILGAHTEPTVSGKAGVTMESYYNNPDTIKKSSIDKNIHYWQDASFVKEEYLIVTDNPLTLRIPKFNEQVKSKIVKETYSKHSPNISQEARSSLSDSQIEKMIFRQRSVKSEAFATMKKSHELDRKSVGNPLIMKLPSECVIPVHVPGNVKQHVGYFVVLDQEGNPIECPDGDDYYGGLANPTDNTLTSSLIKKVQTNMGSGSVFNPNNALHQQQINQVYSEIVEKDLINRVRNGVYSSSVSLAKNEEIYRIMLSRVLSKKYTQILYLPVEYLTYIAYKYSDDGVGRSLLDDTSMINTLRSVMLFTDVMASVKNSIGQTKVTVDIPPEDPNPMKTLETVMDEVVRSRMVALPLGVSNPSDIFEFIQRAGYQWEFNGHKGLPNLKFDFVQTNSNYVKPDTDLQDLLRKSSISAYGLSPEIVDNGFNAEFATTSIANNLLLSKRVSQMQEVFCPLISDHLRKVAINSEYLVKELKEILEGKPEGINLEIDDISFATGIKIEDTVKTSLIVNKALRDFLNNFYIELPKPASVTLENQLEELKTYSDGLDVALDAYISDTFFTSSTAGEVSNEANTIKAMLKAHYVRKWLSDKGIMSELSEITATDENGKPQFEMLKTMSSHVASLVRAGITTLANLKPTILAANADLSKMNNGEALKENTPSETLGSEEGNTDLDEPLLDTTDLDETDLGSDLSDDATEEEKKAKADKDKADTSATQAKGDEPLL
jgi:hypothetical protein